MWNQWYDMPDWVRKTSYRCNYTSDLDSDLLDQDSYQLYRGWLIDSHTKFSKSQFLMMVSLISSDLSLFLYLHLRTRSQVIAIFLSMQCSWVNTEYSIHRVLHTPSTAYTKYCIYRVLHTPFTASSQHRMSPAPIQSHILLSDLIVLNSLHCHHYESTNK